MGGENHPLGQESGDQTCKSIAHEYTTTADTAVQNLRVSRLSNLAQFYSARLSKNFAEPLISEPHQTNQTQL